MIKINKIYNADCKEILKKLPDKSIDLILTDPPYGIKMDKGILSRYGEAPETTKIYARGGWDDQPPTKEIFEELLRVGKKIIIFGGNYFTDKIPVSGHWIVWDKKGTMKFKNPFSDCELAWTNIKRKNVKKYTIIQQGFINDGDERIHPTQKPYRLMCEIIKDYAEKGDLIADFFSGSGTTCLAAKDLGFDFIGVEKDNYYYNKSIERLKGIGQNGQISIFAEFENL